MTSDVAPPTDPDSPLPKGLRFFAPHVSPAAKRRRWIFVVCYLLGGSMVLWPVYPWFAAPKPLILGLPMSLAWVVAALGAVFVALLWLYRSEPQDAEE